LQPILTQRTVILNLSFAKPWLHKTHFWEREGKTSKHATYFMLDLFFPKDNWQASVF
jgi:hypothetical protein